MIVLGGWPDRVVLGTGRFGVRPDEFSTLGDFDGPLENDPGPTDALTEFMWTVTSLPSDGTVTANDDGGFSHVDAADGSYSTVYHLYAWQAGGPISDRGTGTITTNFGEASISPAAGELALSGASPTAIQNSIRAPGAGAVVLEGLAPTVSQAAGGIVVNPLTGALVFTGLSPTALVSDNQVVTPGAGALSFEGLAPTIPVSSPTFTPSPGVLALEGLAPEITVTGQDTATSAKYLGRPNVHISKGKRKREDEESLPAQITNMPGAPAPRGRGLGLDALDAVPLVELPAAPAAPQVQKVDKRVAVDLLRKHFEVPAAPTEPVAPAESAAPAEPVVFTPEPSQPPDAPTAHEQMANLQVELLERMEAMASGVSNRLVEMSASIQRELSKVSELLEEEREINRKQELRTRNLAKAKEIADKFLRD